MTGPGNQGQTQPQGGQAGMWGPRWGSGAVRRWLLDLIPHHHHPAAELSPTSRTLTPGGGNVTHNMSLHLRGHTTVLHYLPKEFENCRVPFIFAKPNKLKS